MDIKDINKNLLGQVVKISGWIKNHRKQNTNAKYPINLCADDSSAADSKINLHPTIAISVSPVVSWYYTTV